MSKAYKDPEDGTKPQTAQEMPVVKPRGAGSAGRSTLEDRVDVSSKPSLLAPKAARSTFRDLRPV